MCLCESLLSNSLKVQCCRDVTRGVFSQRAHFPNPLFYAIVIFGPLLNEPMSRTN